MKYELCSYKSNACNWLFSFNLNSPSYLCLLELNNLNTRSFLSAPSGNSTLIGFVLIFTVDTLHDDCGSSSASGFPGQVGQSVLSSNPGNSLSLPSYLFKNTAFNLWSLPCSGYLSSTIGQYKSSSGDFANLNSIGFSMKYSSSLPSMEILYVLSIITSMFKKRPSFDLIWTLFGLPTSSILNLISLLTCFWPWIT